MSVSELIEQLGELKKQSSETYKLYKQQKDYEEAIRAQLSEALRQTGLKSAKGKHYLASIADKVDFEITHEQSVIDWIKNEPDVEADAYIGLKKTEFKKLAGEVLKQTGEIIPGTQTIHKEVLTIRSNK